MATRNRCSRISGFLAIAGILKNAFIEAYRPSFENIPEREKDEKRESF